MSSRATPSSIERGAAERGQTGEVAGHERLRRQPRPDEQAEDRADAVDREHDGPREVADSRPYTFSKKKLKNTAIGTSAGAEEEPRDPAAAEPTGWP